MKTWMMPFLAVAFVACAGAAPEAPEPEEPEAVEPAGQAEAEVPAKAKEAAALAKALRASDDPAAELERRGMSAEQLDAMMFEVASDPELSRAYRAELAR